MNEVDKFVSARLRECRKQCAITQSDLADSLGVSFQQVQKYENAINRISAGRLAEISVLLDIPIEEFFPTVEESKNLLGSTSLKPKPAAGSTLTELKQVALSLEAIPNPVVRESVVKLIAELSNHYDRPDSDKFLRHTDLMQ